MRDPPAPRVPRSDPCRKPDILFVRPGSGGLALLADYMFFERDLGMCTLGLTEDGNPYVMCTLCLTYIYGCICPCCVTVVLPVKEALKAAGGGGPDAPDAAEPEDPWLRNYLRNRKMHHRK